MERIVQKESVDQMKVCLCREGRQVLLDKAYCQSQASLFQACAKFPSFRKNGFNKRV